MNIQTGWIDITNRILSSTTGPLLGVFSLALLVPGANWKGALIGIFCSYSLIFGLTLGNWGIIPPNNVTLSIENCSKKLNVDTFGTEWITDFSVSIFGNESFADYSIMDIELMSRESENFLM